MMAHWLGLPKSRCSMLKVLCIPIQPHKKITLWKFVTNRHFVIRISFLWHWICTKFGNRLNALPKFSAHHKRWYHLEVAIVGSSTWQIMEENQTCGKWSQNLKSLTNSVTLHYNSNPIVIGSIVLILIFIIIIPYIKI